MVTEPPARASDRCDEQAAGPAPGVVCLHANASNASQWRELMVCLAPTHRVLAPDLHGAGRAPPWPLDEPATLADEVALIEPMLASGSGPVAIVGHSYGAAVALVAAALHPRRVRGLALYEPTLFSLVDAACPPPNEADGIRRMGTRMATDISAGRTAAAAEHFVDYWMREGHWREMSSARRAAIQAMICDAPRWAEALFGESTPLAAFGDLEVPVLLMVGQDSPDSSRAVAALLARTLPCVEVTTLGGMGHMGPMTDAATVNAVIVDFLRRQSKGTTR